MKKIRAFFLSIAVLLSVNVLQAQTADEIVAKHLEAIGGKDKLAKINSLYVVSTSEIMGMPVSTTTTILYGKGYKTEGELNGQKMITVYTDKGGWSINPMTGGSATPMPEEQYKAGEDFLYVDPFFNYQASGKKVELLGREKVGEVDAYKLKLTNKDSSSTTYYIDPTTYYTIQLVKTGNMMGQDVQIKVNHSDYKKTDAGLVLPYTTQMDMGGQFSLTVNTKTAEVNKPVDASVFEMPK